MTRIAKALLAVSLMCLLPASAAWAWARLGHAMVGELAARQLDPVARAEVARLLAGEADPTLAGVASWADDLRDADPERFKATSRWHYINAKGGGCDFDLARDCPDGQCVVGALQQQLAILRDRGQPLEARRDALKFVVHLVGDEHQPMHAGNRPDSGGNRFQISLRTPIAPEAYAAKSYKDGVMGTNLHSIWDYYVLAGRGLDLGAYSDALANAKAGPDLSGTPLDWARESCALIDSAGIYPADDEHVMDHTYLDRMRPLAEARVQLAGARLAMLLNDAIGGKVARPCPAKRRLKTPARPLHDR